jgi:hypothetical protein
VASLWAPAQLNERDGTTPLPEGVAEPARWCLLHLKLMTHLVVFEDKRAQYIAKATF